MANAFSIPQSMGQYIDPINTNLVNTVMSSKQMTYDHNLAKVDEMLKQYTNLPLAREKDKLYLKTRLDNILSTVNSVQKLDLSDNNLTRQIEQSISTAIDDNVLQQISNTQAISKFEQTVAEKRVKNPELYDDRNYTIAKKRAGVDEYLAGKNSKGQEVNTLGSLKYDDYYDVDKNLTEPLQKWAKELGYTKTISETGNDYFIRKETKEVLTPEQIEIFYNTKLQSDPKLMTQMQINSDYQYGGMDDASFKDNYVKSLTSKKEDVNATIAKIEEQKKNLNPDGVAQADNYITAYKEQVKSYDTEIANSKLPDFNRQGKQLQIYSNNLLENYKKTYSKNEIVAIDYDDTPMKILEFREKQAERLQKEREKVASATGLDSQGTPYVQEASTELEQEKADVFTQQHKSFSNSYGALDNYLKANDSNYANGDVKTKKQIRDQITLNLGKENLTAQAYPKELKVLAENYIQQSQLYTSARKVIDTNIDKEIVSYFNGMKVNSADISLDNLSQALPVTARLLSNKNVRNFNDLTKEQQTQVRLEMSDNLKNSVADTEQEKKHLDYYNKDLQRVTGVRYKQKEEPTGILGSLGNIISGGIGYIGQGIFGTSYDSLTNAFSTENANVALRERDKKISENLGQFLKGIKGLDDANSRIYEPDQNLSEISSGQIGLKEGQSLTGKWNTEYRAIEAKVKDTLRGAQENLNNQIGYSYNPNIKGQKPITDALQSLAFANGLNPTEKAPYRVELSPDKRTAKIIVNANQLNYNDKGKQVKTVAEGSNFIIPTEQLPPALLNSLKLSKENWVYDYKNPTPFKKTYAYKVLPNSDSRDEFLEKFSQNNPGILSPEALHEIAVNPASSPIKTAQDYDEQISYLQRLYKLTDENVNEMKNRIVNADYNVIFKRNPGVGYIATVKNNSDPNWKDVNIDLRGQNYDPTTSSMQSFQYLDSTISEQLIKYATQNIKR